VIELLYRAGAEMSVFPVTSLPILDQTEPRQIDTGGSFSEDKVVICEGGHSHVPTADGKNA
jgi:hypothetical protein